jgi:hypothetical protein
MFGLRYKNSIDDVPVKWIDIPFNWMSATVWIENDLSVSTYPGIRYLRGRNLQENYGTDGVELPLWEESILGGDERFG